MKKSDKKEIQFEKKMEIAEIVSHLDALVNSLKEGNIVIEQGNQVVNLMPAGMIDFEMEARQKDDKEKISIGFSWLKKSLNTEPEVLKISSGVTAFSDSGQTDC